MGMALLAIAVYITHSLYYREAEKKDAFHRIRERGFLIALTDENTLNYFIYRGEPMGYQLVLLESFARYLGVPLKIISSKSIPTLNYYLRNNAADLIALNLPITTEGKSLVSFSMPFGETRLALVQLKASGKNKDDTTYVKSLKDFPADTLYVRQNSFFASIYHSIYKATKKKAILRESSIFSQEDLIRLVSEGKIRYAICQENVAMVYKRYYQNIDISLIAYPHYSYCWGVGHASDSLLAEINKWLGDYKSSGKLKKTYLEYFNNQRIVNLLRSNFFSVNSNRLSPYDDILHEQSKRINWDWRLIASLVYEESNFRLGQVSTRSASGLMQLMPETAVKYGIDSLSPPARQIEAGVKYLQYLDKQLPKDVVDPRERVYFVLAAYNVGLGRVLAAREKAEKYGRDKGKWNRHVDYYLLRRSKSNPRANPDSVGTFFPDYKTEGFVDDIVTRFYHYRNLIR